MKTTTTKLSQKELIDIVSDRTGVTKKDIKEIMDTIVESAIELTSSATEDTNVEVKIANGLSVGSKYRSPRIGHNPKDQSKVEIEGKYKPYANFGAKFKAGLNM